MDLIFFKHNKHWEIFTETFFKSTLIKKNIEKILQIEYIIIIENYHSKISKSGEISL